MIDRGRGLNLLYSNLSDRAPPNKTDCERTSGFHRKKDKGLVLTLAFVSRRIGYGTCVGLLLLVEESCGGWMSCHRPPGKQQISQASRPKPAAIHRGPLVISSEEVHLIMQ